MLPARHPVPFPARALLTGALLALAAVAAVAVAGLPVARAADPTPGIGPAVQVSAPGHRAMAPDIALGADGTLHVLYVEKSPPPAEPAHGEHAGPNHHASDELYYRRSTDGGRSFGPPVRVNTVSGEVWGFAVSKPELDVGPDGTVHVMYPANDIQASSGKGNLVARYTRSTDGRRFEPARTLNSAATNDLSGVLHGGFASAHAFGTLVADPAGGVHVFWIDTRLMVPTDSSGALFAASSRDGGRSFAPDVALSRVDVCPCCQLAAAAVGERLYLSSRQTYAGGYRDSAVQVSTDRGGNFGPWVRLGEGRWPIAGCPLKRTAIAARGDDVYTAWFTGGQDPAGVWFARSTDGGRSYAGSVLVHPGAAVSDAPSVVSPGDGTVLVAWHGKTGGDRRVFLRASRDRGASFGPVTEVPAPAGSAAYPELAAAGGRVALAWQQDDAVMVAPVTLAEPAGAGAGSGAGTAASPGLVPVTAGQLKDVLAAKRGKVVLVNFWATWCRPCLREIPDLMALAAELGPRGFELVAVSLDEPADLDRTVRPFMAQFFPELFSYARVDAQMDMTVSVVDPAWNEVLPTSYVIARDGSVAERLQGGKPKEEFRAAVEPLL